ncbi:putative WD repeat-containing protein [Arachis hypogaea]|nr:putative WD repeat-containing protein [Arachis hypogaea]
MISGISWIPIGASKAEPTVVEPPSKEEIQDIITAAAAAASGADSENEEEASDEHMDDAGGAVDEVVRALNVDDALGKADKLDDIALGLKELDMEHYDDKDEGVEVFSFGIGDLYYPSIDQDLYIKDKNDDYDSEELEDMIINPNDSVIVRARTEDDLSLLEVHILEDVGTSEMNMYVHHDIIIPAFPLSTAWLDCLQGREKGNFLVVGSMEPSIEIWDLDVIDAVQLCMVLGGISEKKKKGKKKSIKYKDDSHTDSVLGLAWNKALRNVLASTSADKQVKIWDVATGKCESTIEHHLDKTSMYKLRNITYTLVQAVAWHHREREILLSGSFDHIVVLRDGRMPSHPGYKRSVTADVESLAWDPHTNTILCLEDGTVKCFDVRTAMSESTSDLSSTFTLHAHDKAVTSVSYNLPATGSMDKMVMLWDLSNNQPSVVASKNSNAVRAVFSISFSEDNPFVLAIGGLEGKLQVWDTLSESAVSQRYENYNKNRTRSCYN